MANLFVKRIVPIAKLPSKASPHSAGLDISACFHEPTVTVYDDGLAPERTASKDVIFRLISRAKLNNDYPFEEISEMLKIHKTEGLESYLMGVEFTDEEFDTIKTSLDELEKEFVERKIIDNKLVIYPGERVMIPTGLTMSCDVNHYLAFYPRSGNALKRGLTLINCTGIGDRDYKNEYYITLVNNSRQTAVIENGERCAQMIVRYYADVDICERPNGLPEVESNRNGGFGSSGK